MIFVQVLGRYRSIFDVLKLYTAVELLAGASCLALWYLRGLYARSALLTASTCVELWAKDRSSSIWVVEPLEVLVDSTLLHCWLRTEIRESMFSLVVEDDAI